MFQQLQNERITEVSPIISFLLVLESWAQGWQRQQRNYHGSGGDTGGIYYLGGVPCGCSILTNGPWGTTLPGFPATPSLDPCVLAELDPSLPVRLWATCIFPTVSFTESDMGLSHMCYPDPWEGLAEKSCLLPHLVCCSGRSRLLLPCFPAPPAQLVFPCPGLTFPRQPAEPPRAALSVVLSWNCPVWSLQGLSGLQRGLNTGFSSSHLKSPAPSPDSLIIITILNN